MIQRGDLDRHSRLTHLGFRFGINGPHAARTTMLDDLRVLIAHTPSGATRQDYATAIVAENLLGKSTRKARELSLRHLATLYGLDPANPLFRALRRLWSSDAVAQPLLASQGFIPAIRLFSQFDKAVHEHWRVKTADDIAGQRPTWHKPGDLLRHAKELGPYTRLKAEADAVQAQRSLMAEPDPVRPLLDTVVDLLATGAQSQAGRLPDPLPGTGGPAWPPIPTGTGSARPSAELIEKHHLTPLADLPLGTPEQLQDALDDCDLDHWVSKSQALPNRFEAARHAAVQLLKPNVVHVSPPKRTLNDEAELKDWLAEVESLLEEKLKQGPLAL